MYSIFPIIWAKPEDCFQHVLIKHRIFVDKVYFLIDEKTNMSFILVLIIKLLLILY